LVHNVKVPFTLAHGAAALPFRRLRLLPSALLIGTFAPDFEYFLRLSPDDGFGHTLLGTFILTLPLALLTLWLFHAFVKLPVARFLPGSVQDRLTNHLHEFPFSGVARFTLIVTSILVGIATHLAWDSFTHPTTWLYKRWVTLREPLHLPIIGLIPCYKVLQHGSTIFGIAALVAWLVMWYRASEPARKARSNAVSSMRKMMVGVVVVTVAFVGAGIRAVAGIGVPIDHVAEKRFLGQLVVTAIALAWWQLVAYGVFSSRNSLPRTKTEN
jgi:hypothetical protein